MTTPNPDPLASSRPMCVYRTMYLSGNSTTFQDIETTRNEELKRCVTCSGYDLRCSVYQDIIKFADKIAKMREEHKREMEEKER